MVKGSLPGQQRRSSIFSRIKISSPVGSQCATPAALFHCAGPAACCAGPARCAALFRAIPDTWRSPSCHERLKNGPKGRWRQGGQGKL